MTGDTATRPSGIARIVYKEIVGGDRRKFEAQSNDSKTGGGARDLRFSPYSEFLRVFKRMFPQQDQKGICQGKFYWFEGTSEISKDAFFHPPTNHRPNEGRIANIDKFLPGDRLPPVKGGRVFLILIQHSNGKVWPEFVTERSLRKDPWHEGVKDAILGCDVAKRASNISTAGFIDFERGEVFCNGR